MKSGAGDDDPILVLKKNYIFMSFQSSSYLGASMTPQTKIYTQEPEIWYRLD